MKERSGNRFRQYYLVIVLALIALLIKLLTFYPAWIEHYYVKNIYYPVAVMMRLFFGWLPFSAGDVFYGFLGGYLILKVYRFIKKIFSRQINLQYLKNGLVKVFVFAFSIYIYFNLAWGLNYNRLGIAYQLGLAPKKYSRDDLIMITGLLIKKVNLNRRNFSDSIITLPAYPVVFKSSVKAYARAEKKYPFFHYQQTSLKKSYFGRLGNYLGFLGYYNPFTGEAQVNLTIPRFIVPFVSCHEIAHQLGYASESEANFVGFLTATHSDNSLYHYSAYFDMLRYANSELANIDTLAAKHNYSLLDAKVKGDYRQIRDYLSKTENPFEPVIMAFYDYYLKANQQKNGVYSYNEVVGWLIAFQKNTELFKVCYYSIILYKKTRVN